MKCRHCHAPVLRIYDNETGLHIDLEPHPIPPYRAITSDAVVFENNARAGWHAPAIYGRTVDPIHDLHVCQNKSKDKNMTNDQFDSPAQGVKITEFEGSLLLITPTELRKDVVTKFGPADAVVVNLVLLDGKDSGQTHVGAQVFQKALRAQIEPKLGTGRMVLGRLGRGEAKPGQDPPWILGDPTDADKNLARQHLAATAEPPF